MGERTLARSRHLMMHPFGTVGVSSIDYAGFVTGVKGDISSGNVLWVLEAAVASIADQRSSTSLEGRHDFYFHWFFVQIQGSSRQNGRSDRCEGASKTGSRDDSETSSETPGATSGGAPEKNKESQETGGSPSEKVIVRRLFP